MIQFILALLLFLPFSSLAQTRPSIQEIHFSSGTRGSWEKVWITPDSVKVEKSSMGNEQNGKAPISEEQWQELVQSLEDVPLEQLESLKAPSQGRQSDRAAYSQFTISTEKAQYSSSSFDGYQPPKQLLPLMEKVKNLKEQVLQENR